MSSILIVAGENSGEKYGASLVHEFKKSEHPHTFFGIGGKQMETEGVEVLFPMEELAVVGVFEILSQLPRIKKIFDLLQREIKARKPVAAVLIDSPDFNLRLAKRLKKLSVPVLYYISPTVWAWRKGRLRTIKKYVDKMLFIFPFEAKLFSEKRIPAIYVGHPLKERVKRHLTKEEFFLKHNLDPKRKLITLLPGSRKSEIRFHLPVLLKALKKIKAAFDVQFVLALADSITQDYLTDLIPPGSVEVKTITEDKYEALASSELVLSACGTANLETALLETPLISFYRISPFTYYTGVKLVKLKNYSIVNILAGKKVIPELIQHRFTPTSLFEEAKKILNSEDLRAEMKSNFRWIKSILGEERASENVARELEKIVREPR